MIPELDYKPIGEDETSKTPEEIYQILADHFGTACNAGQGCPYGKDEIAEKACWECEGEEWESWQRFIEGDPNAD